MQGLDLTPDKLKSGQQRSKRLRLWMGLVLAAFLGNMVWVGYYALMVRNEESTLAEVSTQYDEIQEVIRELNRESEELSQWEDRLFVLEELGNYPDYDYLTGFLAQHSPDLLALTKLVFTVLESPKGDKSQDSTVTSGSAAMFNVEAMPSAVAEDTGPLQMTLEGIARDYQVVADYLKTLKTSGLFRNLTLKRTWRQTLLSEETVYFEIECTLLPETAFMGYDYADLSKTESL